MTEIPPFKPRRRQAETPELAQQAEALLALGGGRAAPWLPPVAPGDWEEPRCDEGIALLTAVLAAGFGHLVPAARALRLHRPGFYDGVVLLEVQAGPPPAEAWGASLLFAIGGDFVAHFDGAAPVVHAIRARAVVRLEDFAQVWAYLRFFGNVVCGEDGAFLVVEAPSDLPPWEPSPVVSRIIEGTLDDLWLDGRSADGGWEVSGVVLYSCALFKVRFRVEADGRVEMLDDDPLAADLPIRRVGIVGGERRLW